MDQAIMRASSLVVAALATSACVTATPTEPSPEAYRIGDGVVERLKSVDGRRDFYEHCMVQHVGQPNEIIFEDVPNDPVVKVYCLRYVKIFAEEILIKDQIALVFDSRYSDEDVNLELWQAMSSLNRQTKS
jgi:hypothetical protein